MNGYKALPQGKAKPKDPMYPNKEIIMAKRKTARKTARKSKRSSARKTKTRRTRRTKRATARKQYLKNNLGYDASGAQYYRNGYRASAGLARFFLAHQVFFNFPSIQTAVCDFSPTSLKIESVLSALF